MSKHRKKQPFSTKQLDEALKPWLEDSTKPADTVVNFAMVACGRRSLIAAKLRDAATLLERGSKLGFSRLGDCEYRFFTDER